MTDTGTQAIDGNEVESTTAAPEAPSPQVVDQEIPTPEAPAAPDAPELGQHGEAAASATAATDE